MVPDAADPAPPGPYRDSAGRALTDYPRPSVAVDTVVLTLAPSGGPTGRDAQGRLSTLVVRRPEGASGPDWALPGTFVHPGERLADAVRRSLADKAGVRSAGAVQLAVFDEPGRDDRGWVLSVAHLAALPHHRLRRALDRDPERVALVPAVQPGPLPYDHGAMVARGVTELRRRYAERPDPAAYLGSRFTIRELRLVHEAVAGTRLQKDTFRRAMLPRLLPTQTLSSGTVGRPSQLYRRRSLPRAVPQAPLRPRTATAVLSAP